MPVMPFHLAFPVSSLEKARAFYGGLLGCPEGRSSLEWVDFDFHGHQIVAHLSPDAGHRDTNLVDGDKRQRDRVQAVRKAGDAVCEITFATPALFI